MTRERGLILILKQDGKGRQTVCVTAADAVASKLGPTPVNVEPFGSSGGPLVEKSNSSTDIFVPTQRPQTLGQFINISSTSLVLEKNSKLSTQQFPIP